MPTAEYVAKKAKKVLKANGQICILRRSTVTRNSDRTTSKANVDFTVAAYIEDKTISNRQVGKSVRSTAYISALDENGADVVVTADPTFLCVGTSYSASTARKVDSIKAVNLNGSPVLYEAVLQ